VCITYIIEREGIRFRGEGHEDSLKNHSSNKYHQDANPSLLLAMQKASKVVLNKNILSKSEDLNLVNKLSTFFTMVKEERVCRLLSILPLINKSNKESINQAQLDSIGEVLLKGLKHLNWKSSE
jgi:hypothetical protein